MKIGQEMAQPADVARKAKSVLKSLSAYQKSITALELCAKPVLAAVHSACVGGCINLIAASDIRYSTKDAFFQVKEVDIGVAADVGILQRLPKIVSFDSFVRKICYTGRKVDAAEALRSGLVSRVVENRERFIKGTLDVAQEIANKSPVAVQGTKVSLVYSRDHTVQEGLNHIGISNQLMLQSEDFTKAVVNQATKHKDVVFAKL